MFEVSGEKGEGGEKFEGGDYGGVGRVFLWPDPIVK